MKNKGNLKRYDFVRLYYFTTFEIGLSNIKKQRIKIARILELNDPFEFKNVKIPPNNPTFSEDFEVVLKHWNQRLGIICFSKCFSNPLMWGHYADKSKGMALGFDVRKKNLHDVRYCNNFLDSPIPPIPSDFVNKLVATKARDWRYENEMRFIFSLSKAICEYNVTKQKILFFEKFSEEIQLREILIGPNYDGHENKIRALKRILRVNSFLPRNSRTLNGRSKLKCCINCKSYARRLISFGTREKSNDSPVMRKVRIYKTARAADRYEILKKAAL